MNDLEKSSLHVGCSIAAVGGAVFHAAWGWYSVLALFAVYVLSGVYYARRYIKAER